MVIAVVIGLTAVPLYQAIGREFVPTDVDEAEFNVAIHRARGSEHQLHARGHGSGRARDPLGAAACVTCWSRPVAVRRLAGELGQRATSASRRTKSGCSPSRDCCARRCGCDPWRRVPRQLLAVRGHVRGRRTRCRSSRSCARRCATTRASTSAAARSTSTSSSAGRSSTSSTATARSCASARWTPAATAAWTPRLRLDKPELHVDIDRDRAADLGVSARDIGTALRLMVGGDEEVSRFHDPQTERGLRRPAAPGRRGPQPSRRSSTSCSCRSTTGGLVELGSVATVERVETRFAHRPARPPAHGRRARRRRARASRSATVSS